MASPLNSHVKGHDNGPERAMPMSPGDEGQHRIPPGSPCHLHQSFLSLRQGVDRRDDRQGKIFPDVQRAN